MPFECDHPGCTYSASNRIQLARHKRGHPAAQSVGRKRYNLAKARERVTNGRSFGRAILSGKSRLWTLPEDIFGEIATSLTGKKGSFKQQMRAASNNVTRLARNLTGRGGGRTRRKGKGKRGTRRR